MSKVDNIARMICNAYREDYDRKPDSEKLVIRMWSESILVYLGLKTE
jgi:hypothetical protein